MKNQMIYFLMQLVLLGQSSSTFAQNSTSTASVTVDAGRSAAAYPPALLGTNFTSHRNTAAATSGNTAFVDSTRRIAPTMIRWPGGTIADHFDWKKNEIINAGRRHTVNDLLNLDDIVVFCREVDAELSITINFGTMHADDAADLVEFCNGPGSSFWGQKRDSILAAHALAPGPLDVRYFEIGNETYGKHMFQNSWTAMHPAKYFLGGEAERRGAVSTTVNGQRLHIPLGDLFGIRPGDISETFFLRFPQVKNVDVFLFADSVAVDNCIRSGACTYETFQQVEDLSGQSAGAKVFVLDSLAGAITFGDGNQGFRPPVGSFILVEYTTTGHDGFVAIARRMRQVASSVPIKIGATILPDHPTLPDSTYVHDDSLKAVYEQMDFLVLHHYAPTNGAPSRTYNDRRQIAIERVQEQDDMFQRFRDASRAALGYDKDLGLAISEWNVFNKNDSLITLNRALETAAIGAEWLERTLNGLAYTPVFFAEQFNLAAWGSKFGLIESETGARRIAPLGYLFAAFRSWHAASQVLPVSVQSPQAIAYDRSTPYMQAAAVKSTSGDTLLLMLSNNAENDSISCAITLNGYTAAQATVQILAGAAPDAHNDGAENEVILTGPDTLISQNAVTLAPHSVAFLAFYRDAATSVSSSGSSLLPGFALRQNYPNPFNPTTTIKYELPKDLQVVLKIYNLLGQEVMTLFSENQSAGFKAVRWDGRDHSGEMVSSGVYLYRIYAGDKILSKKMLLLR